MSFWKQYKHYIAIVLLITIPLFSLSSTAQAGEGVSLFGLASFSQYLATSGVGGAMGWLSDLFDSSSSDKIETMNKELSTLREENTRLIGVLQENNRLRKLVGFKRANPKFSLVPAKIISRDVSPFFNVVSVRIETDEKIEVNQPVVSHEGVVGKVHSVSTSYANITLISDSRSGLDVLTQRTRARAVLKGTGDSKNAEVRLSYVTSDSEVRKGDLLVTSGMAGVFPPDLIVGSISEIKPKSNTMFREAQMRLAVDFSRLKTVYVITGNE